MLEIPRHWHTFLHHTLYKSPLLKRYKNLNHRSYSWDPQTDSPFLRDNSCSCLLQSH